MNKTLNDNSLIIRFICGIRRSVKEKFVAQTRNSPVMKYIVELRNRVCGLSLKSFGMILLSATVSNVLFMLVFDDFTHQNQLLLSCLIRALLIFLGIACLFTEIDLKRTIINSLFFKNLSRK